MTAEELTEFDDYHGLTARPEDFDEFWAARMDEADAVELEWWVEPSDEVPSNDVCEYLDLWFRGMGGAKLYAKYVRPHSASPRPLVLQFHGYPGATRSWYEQSSFAGMGCSLIALDNPGQGGRSEDVGGYVGTTVAGHIVAGLDGEPRDLYYVRLYQDVRILCRIVRELGTAGEVDLGRVYVNGASQGGGMGIACCALNADLIDRAAILYPFLSDYRKVYELGLDEIAYEGIRYYSRWFDPDGTREDEWFAKLAYIETNHFAHLVRCPVLFGTGLLDTIVPPETQCAVYNELSCEKRRLLFAGFGHEEIQDFDDQIIDFFDGRRARYEELTLTADDGVELTLMHVAPEAEELRPVILMFHECTRPARGWHHITRYVAPGYHVVQLANRTGAAPETFATSVVDALAAFDLVAGLPSVDASEIVCFGEGFGGALALAVAARRPAAKVVALNPYPTESLVDEAPHVTCPVLLGTSRMDEVAPPASQDILADALPNLIRKNYPKYVHERINAFENEFLAFVLN